MKKHFWKIEYSLTIFVIFGVILLLFPSSFISSKEASYIAKWNDTYNKVDYTFSAISAQADVNIIKSFHKAKSNQDREQLLLKLVKPYLRINSEDEIDENYDQYYMNGIKVTPNNLYYFDKLYNTKGGTVVGIKDIKDDDIYHPGFIMMFDMNGKKGPNTWGKDIYGINIFTDGKITPIGAGWDINNLKSDCSTSGSGVSCSHYYRIGGEFNE